MTPHDVRMRGFRERADVEAVTAWIDALPVPAGPERHEELALDLAAGRVLAHDLVSAWQDSPGRTAMLAALAKLRKN